MENKISQSNINPDDSRREQIKSSYRNSGIMMKEMNTIFSTLVEISNNINYVPVRIKKIKSFRKKLNSKSYNNKVKKVVDIAGCAVVCDTLEDVEKYCEAFENDGTFEIIEKRNTLTKNDYHKSAKHGYRIIKYLFRNKKGTVAEKQVHVKAIWEAYKKEHLNYKERIRINNLHAKEKRYIYQEEALRIEELKKEAIEIYKDAIEEYNKQAIAENRETIKEYKPKEDIKESKHTMGNTVEERQAIKKSSLELMKL